METISSTLDPHFLNRYTIISCCDPTLSFSFGAFDRTVTLTTYNRADSQVFMILRDRNRKYLFVHFDGGNVLSIQNKDGAFLKSQQERYFATCFDVSPVTEGQWAHRACYIKSPFGKALDIKGGQVAENCNICAWSFHGGISQQWIICPIDQGQPDIDEQLPQREQAYQTDQILQPYQPIQIPTQVPTHFVTFPDILYRIVSVLDVKKAITVNEGTKTLSIQTYAGEGQKFYIQFQNNKFFFTYSKDQTRLRVANDSSTSKVDITVSHGQHLGSQFQIVRATQGRWRERGYCIKTHANKALDIETGYAVQGQRVQQYAFHGRGNQVWLILPADQPFIQPSVPQPPNQQILHENSVEIVNISTLGINSSTLSVTEEMIQVHELALPPQTILQNENWSIIPEADEAEEQQSVIITTQNPQPTPTPQTVNPMQNEQETLNLASRIRSSTSVANNIDGATQCGALNRRQ